MNICYKKIEKRESYWREEDMKKVNEIRRS